MTKRKWLLGVAVIALVGGAVLTRDYWSPSPSTAQAPAAPGGPAARVVPVEVAKAERKKVPVRLTALGSVTPMASVALKSRLETEITGVHFTDGAIVKKGDLLFTLDGRSIEAQIAQMEGALARDRAQLAGAERDVARYTDLVAKSATPIINLDNAKTQAEVYRAAIQVEEALIRNFKVQLSYCTIRAPIDGRISAANVKVGNLVRPADVSPLATIIQQSPIYVSFTVPQKDLPDIRRAVAAETATVDAVIPGETKHATGQVAMIENIVDQATGMATVRATMPNTDSLLWPGTLVTADLLLREEEAVVVPASAIQISQTGNFVFVVNNGAAKVQAIKVERQTGREAVISSGLKGGETVVTSGQLLLSDGTRVNPRPPRAAGSTDKPTGS